jgi:hypothetical protein
LLPGGGGSQVARIALLDRKIGCYSEAFAAETLAAAERV